MTVFTTIAVDTLCIKMIPAGKGILLSGRARLLFVFTLAGKVNPECKAGEEQSGRNNLCLGYGETKEIHRGIYPDFFYKKPF